MSDILRLTTGQVYLVGPLNVSIEDANSIAFDTANQDVYIARVGTNDLGIYTNATAGVGGTLRFDVSATAVTSGVQYLAPSGTALLPSYGFSAEAGLGFYRSGTNGVSLTVANAQRYAWDDSLFSVRNSSGAIRLSTGDDVWLRRSAAKTFTLDTDGAGGALTLVDVKGPLTASGLITGLNVQVANTGGFYSAGNGSLLNISDAAWKFVNNAGTAGIGFDFSTDSTIWWKTRGLADTAILKANQLVATSVATSGGLTAAGTVGHPVIVAVGNTVAATNAGTASIATVTPTVDATYEVSANCLVTTSSTHSFSLDCVYTDESNVSRTLVIPVAQLAGTFLTSGLITNVTGAGPYESATMTIRVKASTSVTIRTSSGGTFTGVVYNARGIIKHVS